MKATGIIRKIDDLGRVVIPKEMRKTLRIREGDTMEIYVEKNGEIILKRYAPLGDMAEELDALAESINKNTGFLTCITDTKFVVAASSKLKREYLDRSTSDELVLKLEERSIWINKTDNSIKIIDKDVKDNYMVKLVAPIISDGDVIGSMILLTEEKNKKLTEADLKVIQTAADYLSAQMK